DSVTVGTKSVASLAVGATTMVTINWNTATSSIGVHTLVGSHDFPDDNAANDQGTKVVTVTDPADDIHIGDLDGSASNGGKTWTATVVITVHAMDHTPVSGALVTGSWSALGLNVNQCTTGSDGTCAVVFPDLKKNRSSVTYSVTGVTLAGRPYKPAQNHDLDGSSNGYSITVRKP
ncbi:MAG: hypothetical protein IH616_18620, partial [Gemmatimonadales bacterium]|nr:hypothetical protein [Gemmatimonadales bacterium]